ncbi:hypothetical protein [Halalkalibacter flavus]
MAKKGQTFKSYTEELKREVVRLKLEECWSYRKLRIIVFLLKNKSV